MRFWRSFEKHVELLGALLVDEDDVVLAAHHKLHYVLLSPLVVNVR